MGPASQEGSNGLSMANLRSEDLELRCPFGELGVSEDYLRETAYEIFFTSCRTSPGFGGRSTLTYTPQSEKVEKSSPLSQKSLSYAAASKIKRALGLPSKKSSTKGNRPPSVKPKKSPSIAEVMRQQMRVSEQCDTRLRRAVLRIFSGQLGRRAQSILLPLELLQQLKPSDFCDTHEYHVWQKRQMRILEVALIVHPFVPLDPSNAAALRLRQIVHGVDGKPIETGRNSESMQALRNAVVNLAWRSNDGTSSEMCHWVDGFPLNLHLYLVLLRSCFDSTEETAVIDEIDDVLDLMKKTWTILRINQMLHNICFTWILFQQFVITGQIEMDLLAAAETQLVEVAKDAKSTKDPLYMKVLNSTLGAIQGWAEKRLLAYHDMFQVSGIGLMQSVLPVALAAARILTEVISQENHCKKNEELDIAHKRIDMYIRSSLHIAFTKMMVEVDARRKLLKGQEAPAPALLILAKDTGDLARNEKEIFSPILKIWHPFAAGVAAATLHSCYGKELKQFLSGVTILTPEAVQVLETAERLEKDLVQIAVEDSVDCEDGGKGIIQEMSPYEADSAVEELSKMWIKERLDRLRECVDRSMQQKAWNPMSSKDQYAPSAAEILRTIKEALEAFFNFPVSKHSNLLLDLVAGLDRSLQHYISHTQSGCASKSSYLPVLPPLTRCKKESKYLGLWKRKGLPPSCQKRTGDAGNMHGLHHSTSVALDLPQLYVRMNTLHHIQSELEVLEKIIVHGLKNYFPDGMGMLEKAPVTMSALEVNFELARAGTQEGIQKLCEMAAYKVVFNDLSSVLWEGLYKQGVANARIGPVLDELELNLQGIQSTVNDNIRNRVVVALLKASLEGFLLVLLAGGPSRAFLKHDFKMIEEDFRSLKNLFKADGDRLPADMVEKVAMSASKILPLFCINTEDMIENFRVAVCEMNDVYPTRSRLPLPSTSGVWSPTDPNTLLRVLCYRNDAAASHFLKKTYNLPTSI